MSIFGCIRLYCNLNYILHFIFVEFRKGSAAYEPTVNEVQVPVLHRDLCNEWLVQLNVTEGMICAGYQEGGKDACQVSVLCVSHFLYK